MSRPFRRYCFYLAEKLGKNLDEILSLDSLEISEWMAFDMTNNEEWSKKYLKEKELEKQRSDSQYKLSLFKQLFGGN